jgi:isopropylmalate/homocitrate/citramalate synthase
MYLCDVTLREGDQMPGRSYSAEQKIAAGRVLDRLDVPFVQAGFPITGEKDREVIRELSANADADVIGLARATTGDVEAALDANADVVEVFASLSDLYLEHALGESQSEVLDMLGDVVDVAREGGAEVHLSLADAFRTDPERLEEAFRTFPEVPFVNLADTVGARTPSSVRTLLDSLGERVDLSRVGVHFHDDMGVATANALAAYELGVGKADVSVASLGERAGNPAFEEVVVAGKTDHGDAFGIRTEELVPGCREVLDILDEEVQPRKAVLGTEVTEHESGIHTAAMLDEPAVFEPYDPSDFGGQRRLLFGAGTGRTGARKLLLRANVESTDERVTEFLDALGERGPLETDEAVALARERFA